MNITYSKFKNSLKLVNYYPNIKSLKVIQKSPGPCSLQNTIRLKKENVTFLIQNM